MTLRNIPAGTNSDIIAGLKAESWQMIIGIGGTATLTVDYGAPVAIVNGAALPFRIPLPLNAGQRVNIAAAAAAVVLLNEE